MIKNLEDIQDMWREDSVIDDVLLDEASLKIPRLHSKYIDLLNEYTLLSKKAKQESKKAKHIKTLYYSGKALPEEYEEEPFNYKVSRGDVPNWVSVDDEVMKIEMKIEYYQTVIDMLSDILRQIHQLSFNIKNTIEWRRFTAGV